MPDTAPTPATAPIPTLRRHRHDGWTPERQRVFIETLAATASVTEAAGAAGMTLRSCYVLRNDPRADAFRTAWALALNAAARRLQDIAFDRAVNGVMVPVVSHGEIIGERRVYSDKLLIALLGRHRRIRSDEMDLGPAWRLEPETARAAGVDPESNRRVYKEAVIGDEREAIQLAAALDQLDTGLIPFRDDTLDELPDEEMDGEDGEDAEFEAEIAAAVAAVEAAAAPAAVALPDASFPADPSAPDPSGEPVPDTPPQARAPRPSRAGSAPPDPADPGVAAIDDRLAEAAHTVAAILEGEPHPDGGDITPAEYRRYVRLGIDLLAARPHLAGHPAAAPPGAGPANPRSSPLDAP